MHRRNRGPDRRLRRWWTARPWAYDEVISALADQPLLRLEQTANNVLIKGRFSVCDKGITLDSFAVRIHFPANYPSDLPIVELVGDRIPTSPDRHVNSDRSACLFVPEEWLAQRPDSNFASFLRIPVRNFLLGQLYFEKHKVFPPTGERAHYGAGLVEAYADILGVDAEIKGLHYWLRLLSTTGSKGHWLCPCDSGAVIRKCCRDKVFQKQQALPKSLAERMKRKVEKELNSSAKPRRRNAA